MKHLVTALAMAVCMTGVTGMAFADMTPQQQKMAACNKQVTGKTGDDRKTAMKACLSASAPAAAPAAPAAPAMSNQQNKMADCNKQAAGKTGADRKAFMKSCLSGSAAAPAMAPAAPAAPAPMAKPAAPAAPATPAATPMGKVDKNGKPLSAQQVKMGDCAHQAKGKKGDDYKQFMSQCLKK